MIIINTGQDNTIICRAGQSLSQAVTGAIYVLTIFNKIYKYTFLLTDSSGYPQSYSRFMLQASDIVNWQEADYTYTLALSTQPNTVLDTGKFRIMNVPSPPVAYINTTEAPMAYNPST